MDETLSPLLVRAPNALGAVLPAAGSMHWASFRDLVYHAFSCAASCASSLPVSKFTMRWGSLHWIGWCIRSPVITDPDAASIRRAPVEVPRKSGRKGIVARRRIIHRIHADLLALRFLWFQ